MSLGGGVYTSYNKVLPGSYINTVSSSGQSATTSERGVVAFLMPMKWGKDGQVFEVSREQFFNESVNIFGYPIDHDELKPMRELFINAQTVKFYKLNTGVVASSSNIGSATCKGTRGNDIKVIISENVEDSSKFNVVTKLDDITVDEQKVTTASDLVNNQFVAFNITTLTSGSYQLEGGTDVTPTVQELQDGLTVLESESFNIIATTLTESNALSVLAAYTKRMRDAQGVKFQAVVYNMDADYEGIISVANSADLVPFTAGLEAACELNRSCTNAVYTGECEISNTYTQYELESFIKSGKIAYHKVGSQYRLLMDINTLKTVTSEKGEEFKSNQTLRVLDTIANDVAEAFNEQFLGVIQNDQSGRVSFWSKLVSYMAQLFELRAIEEFNSEQDIVVEKGTNKNDILVSLQVQPVNCMEKLYMTIYVN